MGILGEMKVVFSADITKLNAGIASAQTSVNKFAGAASSVSPLVGVFAAVGTAALQMGVDSVKSAADFEATMNKVQALAGVSADQANIAKDALLKMASEVGQTPQKLADGLYYIASAGYSSADSLKILEASSKAASVGMTDTQTVANAMTSAMKAFNIPASETNKVVDMMTKTVSTGKTEWADYAGVIGKLSLNASQAKVSFGEANAAFAILTNTMPSSKQAADSLNALLQTSSRIDLLTNRSKALGISFDANAYSTMNLQQRMQYLNQITGGNVQQLTTLLGRQNAVAAMTALGTNNFKEYGDALKGINNSAGAADAAFEKVSAGFNMSIQKLQASFEALKIKIGSALLPLLTPVVGFITQLVTAFMNADTATGPLGKTFEQVAGMTRVISANFQQLGQDLSPLSSLFVQFGQQIGQMLPGAAAQFMRIANILVLVFVSLAEGAAQIVGPALKLLMQIFQSAQSALAPVLDTIQGQLVPAFDNLVQALAPVVASIVTWIQQSGVIPLLFKAISLDIQVVITVLSFLINWIAQVITWLNKMGVFTFVISTLVQPTIIALNIMISVIQGIIDIVTFLVAAWNGIPAWWSGIWTAVSGFFVGIWTSLTSWWSSLWTGTTTNVQNTTNGLSNWWSGVWTGFLNILQITWNAIVTAVQIALQFLVQSVSFQIQNIGAFFVWLYEHNIYIKALCDAIVGFFNAAIVWIQMAWQASVNWIVGAWGWLGAQATAAWNAVSSAVVGAVNTAVAWLQAQWNIAASAVSAKWNEIAGQARAAWTQVSSAVSSAINTAVAYLQAQWNIAYNAVSAKWNQFITLARSVWTQVSGVFGGIWNTYIATPMNNLYNSFTKWFSNLASAAGNAGRNLINSLASGISGAAGAIGNAIHSAISGQLRSLGFVNIPGFASGVQNFGGGLALVGENGPEIVQLPKGANVYPSGTMPQSGGSSGGASALGGNQYISIELDGEVLTEIVANRMAKTVRARQGRRTA